MTEEVTPAMLRGWLATIEEVRHHLMDARSDEKDEVARGESLGAMDDLLGRIEAEARGGLEDTDAGVAMSIELLRKANHAIRGPLGAAMGHLDLLRDGQGLQPDQVTRSVEAAWEGAAMTDRFVQEFFDTANAWTKRPVAPRHPVSVPALMSEVLDVAEAHAKGRRVTIRRDVAADMRRARVDPDGFQEMIELLVEHAIDAAPAGSDVDVKVRPGRGTIRVEVAHAGNCPWSPQRHFQLFEPADAGAPIGLSALRELARMRAGDAGVEKRQAGEVLWFDVPDWKGPDPTSAAAAKAAHPVQTDKTDRKAGTRILVVEDDRIDREGIQAILEDAGYDVDTANTVDAAAVAVEKHTYAAITLDLLLGRSYSMRVLSAARNGRNKDAAILALSATRPGNVAFPFPVQGHLQKPVKRRVLLRALRWSGVPPPIGGPVVLLAAVPIPGLEAAISERGRRLLHVQDAAAALEALCEDPSLLVVGPGMHVTNALLDDLQGTAVVVCGPSGHASKRLRTIASAILPIEADIPMIMEELDGILEEALTVEGGTLPD